MVAAAVVRFALQNNGSACGRIDSAAACSRIDSAATFCCCITYAAVLLLLPSQLHQSEFTEAAHSAICGTEQHVLQIRLLLDPKRSGKWSDAKDQVGLTVSMKPTWIDRKDAERVSEMSEQVLRVCVFARQVYDSIILSLWPVSAEHE